MLSLRIVIELQKIENIMEIETPIDPKSKEFEKVMFIYQVALKEINTKLEILKDEFKLFYEYDLIDHINTRIKSPESITTIWRTTHSVSSVTAPAVRASAHLFQRV